jgi:hypothetical protein
MGIKDVKVEVVKTQIPLMNFILNFRQTQLEH